MWFTRTRDDRGAASVEVVLIAPVIVLLIGVMIAGWRLWSARSATQQAAEAAARAASIARSGSDAQQRADQVARTNLQTLGVKCSDAAVSVDVGAFALPPGTEGQVSVRVRCDVSFADLFAPGLPGGTSVTTSASERLDTFRERRP